MKKNNVLIFIIVILVILLAICLVIIYKNNYFGTESEELSSGENVTENENLNEDTTELLNTLEENNVSEEITDEERQKVEEYANEICNGGLYHKMPEFEDINEAEKDWIYNHLPNGTLLTKEDIEKELKNLFGTNLEINVEKDTENADGYYIPKYYPDTQKYEAWPYGADIKAEYAIDTITKNGNNFIIKVVEYSILRDFDRNADLDYAVFAYNKVGEDEWKNWEKVFELERSKDTEKEEIEQKVLEQKDKFLSYNFVIEENDIGSFNAIEFKKVNK